MANFGSFFGPIFEPNAVSECFLRDLGLLPYQILERGILLRSDGSGFLSTAHTDEDINAIIEAIQDSIAELQKNGFLRL